MKLTELGKIELKLAVLILITMTPLWLAGCATVYDTSNIPMCDEADISGIDCVTIAQIQSWDLDVNLTGAVCKRIYPNSGIAVEYEYCMNSWENVNAEIAQVKEEYVARKAAQVEPDWVQEKLNRTQHIIENNCTNIGGGTYVCPMGVFD